MSAPAAEALAWNHPNRTTDSISEGRARSARVRAVITQVAPAPNDIAELEPEFKIMLQATNRSPRTIGAYMAGVDALRAFLVERGMPTTVDAVAREHVEAFYAWMLETGYAAASVKNRHDGIRQFFAWCARSKSGSMRTWRSSARGAGPRASRRSWSRRSSSSGLIV